MFQETLPYSIAIVGATGAVGQRVLTILEERYRDIKSLHLFSSGRIKGQKAYFHHKEYPVKPLKEAVFENIDIAFFAAGSAVSAEYIPQFIAAGVVVIDKSSLFRMDADVPLVVPEVNGAMLKDLQKGLVANPNCSTIALVMALYPLHKYAQATRVVVSTYQSVSGAGQRGMIELERQTKAVLTNGSLHRDCFAKTIAFNVIPQIDSISADGSTKEEQKMMTETQKILQSSVQLAVTCVRVPVFIGHSLAVAIEFEKSISVAKAKQILQQIPGIVVLKDNQDFLTPIECSNEDSVYVSRIRKDPSVANGLLLWVVCDNLRKGAALNAVQIMEKILKFGLKKP